jgi:hypothetical protein
MPTFIWIVVIASLCLSVGEGLRLTPFPVSDLARTQTTELPREATDFEGDPFSEYGPLDIPNQNQKRNKRQLIEFACPHLSAAREEPTYRSSLYKDEPVHRVFLQFVSRPAGRAPPFLS